MRWTPRGKRGSARGKWPRRRLRRRRQDAARRLRRAPFAAGWDFCRPAVRARSSRACWAASTVLVYLVMRSRSSPIRQRLAALFGVTGALVGCSPRPAVHSFGYVRGQIGGSRITSRNLRGPWATPSNDPLPPLHRALQRGIPAGLTVNVNGLHEQILTTGRATSLEERLLASVITVFVAFL